MGPGDWTAVASVVVASIAALSAYAAQRAAANASSKNVAVTSRTEIEKEAFERAEQFLTGTITRQDAEIEDLRKDVDRLTGKVRGLEQEREKDKSTIATQADQIRVLSAVVAARGEL